MKECKKCKLPKSLDDFPKKKDSKDGKHWLCKLCINQRNKEYRDSNTELLKKARKNHYQKNLQKMRKEKRDYCKQHRKEKQIYDVGYRKQNKEKIAKYKKDWEKERRHDPIFKLKRNLRRRVHHALKDNYKSAHTMELIGCTIEEFKEHIEKQFQDGMSWENWGPDGWHIDHIIPCYKFDLSKPEEQRKCFHYTNQRPLWATDNLSRPRPDLYDLAA